MQRIRGLLLITALLTTLISIAAACGSSSSSSGGTSTSAPASTSGTVVHIKDFSFHPSTLHVKTGTKVTFVNDDSTDHTATAPDGAFNTGHIKPGASATVTVSRSGTIPYICEIHQFMHGQLEVTS